MQACLSNPSGARPARNAARASTFVFECMSSRMAADGSATSTMRSSKGRQGTTRRAGQSCRMRTKR